MEFGKEQKKEQDIQDRQRKVRIEEGPCKKSETRLLCEEGERPPPYTQTEK